MSFILTQEIPIESDAMGHGQLGDDSAPSPRLAFMPRLLGLCEVFSNCLDIQGEDLIGSDTLVRKIGR